MINYQRDVIWDTSLKDIDLNSDGLITQGQKTTAGAPTVTAGKFIPGALIQIIDGTVYQNTGTTASPAWSILENSAGGLPLDPYALGLNIMTNQGTIIGVKDNASSLRVKGLQDPSEGVVQVQNYAGIFYNAAYATNGTLKTRAIWGGNVEMDVEIQSPHALLLTAVDDSQADGVIFASSKTNFVFNLRADAETPSPHQLIVDRVSTGTTGVANTSDIAINTNTGSIYFNNGVTTGTIVIPKLTTVQIGLLVAVKGMLVYDTSLDKIQVYDGAWTSLN